MDSKQQLTIPMLAKVIKIFRFLLKSAYVPIIGQRITASTVMIILTVVLASCAVIKPLREKIAGAIVE